MPQTLFIQDMWELTSLTYTFWVKAIIILILQVRKERDLNIFNNLLKGRLGFKYSLALSLSFNHYSILPLLSPVSQA